MASDCGVPVGEREPGFHLDWNYTIRYHKAPVSNVGQVTLQSQDNLWNGPIKAKPSLAGLNLLNNKKFAADAKLNWGVRQQPRQIQGTLAIRFC